MQLSAFTADHFPLGQAAMQVNEGLPAYIVSALERRYGGLQRQDRRHPRHGLQGRVRRPARVAQLQAAQAAVVGRRARRVHRSVRQGRPPRPPSTASSRRATSSSSARRTSRTAASRSAARTSSTSGAPSARGSGCSADPRHRRGRVHQRLPRPGAARGRPRGRRARRLQQVRPADRSRTTTTRATGSSRATPRTRR